MKRDRSEEAINACVDLCERMLARGPRVSQDLFTTFRAGWNSALLELRRSIKCVLPLPRDITKSKPRARGKKGGGRK